MPAPAVVWLVIGLVTAVAILAVLIGLVRHVRLLTRTLGRFQSEVGPLAQEAADHAARASERAAGLTEKLPQARL